MLLAPAFYILDYLGATVEYFVEVAAAVGGAKAASMTRAALRPRAVARVVLGWFSIVLVCQSLLAQGFLPPQLVQWVQLVVDLGSASTGAAKWCIATLAWALQLPEWRPAGSIVIMCYILAVGIVAVATVAVREPPLCVCVCVCTTANATAPSVLTYV